MRDAVELQHARDEELLDAIADAIGIERPERLAHPAPTVVEAFDHPRQLSPAPAEPATTHLSQEDLCDELVERIPRRDYGSIEALADHYAPDLIRLGLMREDPAPGTVKRAFQRLLSTHVYPPIPEQLLPPHVAAGRKSGSLRHRSAAPASDFVTSRRLTDRT
jgi:hypothetical protein